MLHHVFVLTGVSCHRIIKPALILVLTSISNSCPRSTTLRKMFTFIVCPGHCEERHLSQGQPWSLEKCLIFSDQEYYKHIMSDARNEGIAGTEVSEDIWDKWEWDLARWYYSVDPTILQSMLEKY